MYLSASISLHLSPHLSELRSTERASSRVSCNHRCELNFDFPKETSDRQFAHGSKVLSVWSSQCYSCCLQCRLSQLVALELRHHVGVSRTRWSGVPPELSSLGEQHVLSRLLLFLIDSRSDVSHHHIVSTFWFIRNFTTDSFMFSCSNFGFSNTLNTKHLTIICCNFLILQRVLPELFHVLFFVLRLSPVHPSRSSCSLL